jgi:hypothetical protein
VVTVTNDSGDKCHGVLVNTGPNCVETEEYDASFSSSNSSVTTATGITSCNPSGCKFDPDDAACEVGAGTGTYTEDWHISGNTMTATRNDALAICHTYNLPTTTVWTKQ